MTERIGQTAVILGGLAGLAGLLADSPLLFLIGVAGLLVSVGCMIMSIWRPSC